MSEDKVSSVITVDSPIMEEIYAAFEAISDLEALVLQAPESAGDFSSFHSQFKHWTGSLTSYYGQPSNKEIGEEISKERDPAFVPFSICAFHDVATDDEETFPELKPTFPVLSHEFPPLETTVKTLQYPVMTSVAFSFIDERPQLLKLIEHLKSQNEIGVSVFVHPEPLTLCALCLSVRECEYLVDAAEVPTVVADLSPVFADPGIAKVVHNTAETCRYLHMFGAGEFLNVFCLTTAALHLDLPTPLCEMTRDVRMRLSENWIAVGSESIRERRIEVTRSEERMSGIVMEIQSKARHDWRLRPISLRQMNLARQEVHYLLYLYDSMRCRLNAQSGDVLKHTVQVSHQKAMMDWSRYRFILKRPNAAILASLYRQPLPNRTLFSRLMNVRGDYADCLSEAAVLWLSVDIPSNDEALKHALAVCEAGGSTLLVRPADGVSSQVQSVLLGVLKCSSKDRPPPLRRHEKTIQEIIEELGWIQVTPGASGADMPSVDCLLETPISPRLKAETRTDGDSVSASGGYIKHLRNPDQPTSVSQQIEGIPRTESKIYALANNVRIMQKMQGKTKAKLPAAKDDHIPDTEPEDMLHKLMHIGYIDDHMKKRILEKIQEATKTGSTQTGSRAQSSGSSSKQRSTRPQTSGLRHGPSRRRP